MGLSALNDTPLPTLPARSPFTPLDVYKPVVPVRIAGPSGFLSIWALVDTGSDFTIFLQSVAQVLGIHVNQTKPTPIHAVGGTVLHTYPGTADLTLNDQKSTRYNWTTPVAFIPYQNPSQASSLLGHAGCLNFFRATFDDEKHQLAIVPNNLFPGTII